MRKIIVGAMVSLDGVMQAPGGPQEDPTGGFKFGGWVMPLGDETFGQEIGRLFDGPFDLLLGRKTYEIFAAYWPYQDENGPEGFIVKTFAAATKYPVSASGELDTGWNNTVLLRGIEDIRRLKETDGPPLVTQGSTELVHALLAADLVDAISIFTGPVVLGGGKKLFVDGSAPHAFRLTSGVVSGSGMLIAHYEKDGQIKTGPDLGPPSEKELARRERMRREG